MKLCSLILCMSFVCHGLCFGDEIPFFEDNYKNMEYRLEVANSSLHALHGLLPRIQQIIHDDPNKACDLICNAMKFLENAERCLYTE